ncbi:hypothetical protein [Lactiplantibacillus paraxiangfangensis]|uniref:hypothetical protein n=1 Tax=Lactiplantibacillus paraxiangfangensis TaxID=3076224 RepID=UPI0030C756CA
MKRKESKHDHIDFDKLLDLIHEVEDRHDGSVMPASREEMAAIWKIARVTEHPGPPKAAVSLYEYEVIKSYSLNKVHTAVQRDEAVAKINFSYEWLVSRVREYRNGSLRVKREGDESGQIEKK